MSTYAIIETGAKQYWVEPKSVIEVEKLTAEKNKEVILDQVLFARHEDKIEIGAPTVKGAKVVCTYLGDTKGEKLEILFYRPKKHSRRHIGHRQQYSKLLVKEIKF